MNWTISRLEDINRSTSSLRKDPFNSGNTELDAYLKRYAKHNDRLGTARTFVALAGEDNYTIAGYYACSANLLDRTQLPPNLRENLPNYPPPAMLLGKLAVDQSMQGRGLGKRLLRHAFENALNLSQNMGIYAVRVDAIDEQAKEFYKRCGFLEYQDSPFSLFILMSTIKQAANW
ncbi:GNAT family N-acetyltransferase [Microcoleus sp. F10-C6]|uniref:GNAT family N-acetyltransferase n=1 Tax=unclassified Microcoleus TaxID=2642155 RepID=UPI002FD0DEB7